MGKTTDAIFNPQVSGTGQSVRDLSNIGYTPDQIQQMGIDRSPWQSFGAKAIKGGLSGLSNALQRPNWYGS